MALGLREKFLAPMLVVVAVGLLLMVVFFYQRSISAVEHNIRRGLEREVVNAVMQMDIWLQARKTDLATWSQNRVFVDALTEKGYYGTSARLGAGQDLRQLNLGYPYYHELMLIDSLGRKVACSGEKPEQEPPEFLRKNYFKASMSGRSYVSSSINGGSAVPRSFVISAPVRSGEGISGVLAGKIRLSSFNTQFVSNTNQGQGGYALLIDRKGVILAGALWPAMGKADISGNPFGRSILEMGTGSFIYEFKGMQSLASFASLEETGWILIHIRSLDQAFAPARETGAFAAVVGLLVLAAVIAAIILFFRFMVSAPIGAMIKAIGQIEAGNLGARIPGTSRKDEIGVLTNAFNTMAARLSRTLGSLTEEIADRKVAQKALRKSEEKYRTILQSIQEGYFEVDLKGNFTFFNDPLQRVLGNPPGELLGMNYRRCMSEATAKTVLTAFNRVYESREPIHSIEWELISNDGSRRPIEVSVSVVLDSDGRRIGFRGVCRDISGRRKAEEERCLLEERLLQSQKMEAVGTLASGIAHDFNNILQAINGSLHLIKLQPEPEPLHRYADEIARAVERGSDLVRGLLTFSRKVEPRLNPVDIARELEQVVQMLRRAIPKMIRIESHIPEGLRMINGDPGQLEQVFMNLGNNARDAMPQGGLLQFRAENISSGETGGSEDHLELNEGDYVRITVSDTGQGMDAQTVKNSFDPFYTTKQVGKGTGLGLSTAYGIVEKHGGRITCRSQPGEGTVFDIYLPAADPAQAPAAADDHWDAQAAGGGEMVLVVDDEQSVRDTAREILQLSGYHTLAAPDGESALELYHQNEDQIDLVVLDLGMPGMGGRRCLDELFKLDPAAKVIIASGYSDEELVNGSLQAGAVKYIHKPYKGRDLLAAVGAALG